MQVPLFPIPAAPSEVGAIHASSVGIGLLFVTIGIVLVIYVCIDTWENPDSKSIRWVMSFIGIGAMLLSFGAYITIPAILALLVVLGYILTKACWIATRSS